MVSDKLVRHIIREVTSGPQETTVEVHYSLPQDYKTKFGVETVGNVLRQSGMNGAAKIQKPELSRRHMKARLRFVKKYHYYTAEDWKRVIWSDETKRNRCGSDDRKWCWKTRGRDVTEPRTVQGTIKHGGGNIMIWGCMLYNGPDTCVR